MASTTSAARTDRWGKERSVVGGALVMIPCGLLLVALQSHVGVGLVALAVFIAAFEFSIVSTIPIGAELSPGTPGRGIGTLLAAGTVGRMLMAVPATVLYEAARVRRPGAARRRRGRARRRRHARPAAGCGAIRTGRRSRRHR